MPYPYRPFQIRIAVRPRVRQPHGVATCEHREQDECQSGGRDHLLPLAALLRLRLLNL
jgi:hypothetical protein